MMTAHPGKPATSRTWHLRAAAPEDASAIYALKAQAFGHTALLYTIYQAPQSVEYIRDLICQGSEVSGHHYCVAHQGDRFVGYYDAIGSKDQDFLNYIAVGADWRGSGIGQALLSDYERTGSLAGCTRFALDVLQSNAHAAQWYSRQGYRLQEARYMVRLPIKSLPFVSSMSPQYSTSEMARALGDEQSFGFGKIQCTISDTSTSIGLIGGHSCKLLSYELETLDEILAGVRALFGESRRAVIITGLSEIPERWPVLSAERSLRLMKYSGSSRSD